MTKEDNHHGRHYHPYSRQRPQQAGSRRPHRSVAARRRCLDAVRTNADGRTDEPLVAPKDAKAGAYEIVFYVDEYFDRLEGGEERFIDRPVVRFNVFDVAQHYHVPMLCTPGSCSTYRGS